MKKTITFLIFILFFFQVYTQTGTITNISVQPRTDGSGMVDVYFDLSGEAVSYNILIEVSFDAGANYTPIPTSFLSGDLTAVSPGSRHVVWDGYGSFPGEYSAITKLKIIANQTTTGSGNIFYLSDETGNRNIYVGQLENGQILNSQPVTNYVGNDFISAYDICKNTGKIAYVVSQDGRRGDLFIKENINTESVLVPNQPSDRIGPQIHWAPDGESLIFSLGADQHYHHLRIYQIQPDGTGLSEIITLSQPRGSACHKSTIHWDEQGMYLGVTPQWSSYHTMFDLWYRNPDGNYSKITNTTGIGERNAFIAPDNYHMVFETTDNSGRRGMRHMPKTGGNQTTIITHSTEHRVIPCGWLDENTILYYYKLNSTSETYDLYLIHKDGSNATNISNNPDANITHGILF